MGGLFCPPFPKASPVGGYSSLRDFSEPLLQAGHRKLPQADRGSSVSARCLATVFTSWGCCTKFPQAGWRRTGDIYSLTAQEARSPKIKVSAGPAPSAGSKGGSSPPLPAPGVPGLRPHHPHLCLCSTRASSLCLCVSLCPNLPLLTSRWIRVLPLQCDLILT